MMALSVTDKSMVDELVSYAIYTVERLPKGTGRRPKWHLHSLAEDRLTAEDHARILSEQPYFDIVQVREFRACPATGQRHAAAIIRSYSRRKWINLSVAVGVLLTVGSIITILAYL